MENIKIKVLINYNHPNLNNTKIRRYKTNRLEQLISKLIHKIISKINNKSNKKYRK